MRLHAILLAFFSCWRCEGSPGPQSWSGADVLAELNRARNPTCGLCRYAPARGVGGRARATSRGLGFEDPAATRESH